MIIFSAFYSEYSFFGIREATQRTFQVYFYTVFYIRNNVHNTSIKSLHSFQHEIMKK